MAEITIGQYLQTFFSSPYHIITLSLFSIVTSFITYQFLKYKLRLFVRIQDKIKIEKKKRDAFKLLLDRHSDLIVGKHLDPNKDTWVVRYSEMSKDILLWGSDRVIAEYGQYIMLKTKSKKDTISPKNSLENKDKQEMELHFAKAVLAFRQEVGYKNIFHRIKPEYIIQIFKSGNDKDI